MPDKQDQLLEQNNIKHAIIGEKLYGLPDILHGLAKLRLASLASVYNVNGRSKMKREELVDALLERIEDPEVLQATLIKSKPKEWELFESLLKGSFQQSNSTPYGYYYYFLDRGLLFTFFDANRLHLIIPDEVKTALDKLNEDDFMQVLRRSHLIYSYILASVNLYGVVTPAKLAEIYNAQNESPLTEEELLQYLLAFLGRGDQYFGMHQGYIVSLDMGDAEFDDLLGQVQHKPPYVPDKREFLNYADHDYFEMTPQLAALRDFVRKEFRLDREMAEYLVDDIQLGCSMEASLQNLIYEFERRDLEFETQKQAQKAVALITDVYNHTRMWSNAGHTPMELRQMHENSGVQTANAPLRVSMNNQIRANKVGRNDPCPCGSGLKYKKCCGK
ncbi:SEC-C metal-binding domain-containing protein [Paenibacillus macerans]|uniref:SEC-C metal-binding domain-containing protein n=1 Tax=Paenibacillus macerans TaxID=44252 RepID=UPI003D3107DC